MVLSVVMSLVWIGLQSNPFVGHWISVDDATGKEKSEISLYLENGKLYGKVERGIRHSQCIRHLA